MDVQVRDLQRRWQQTNDPRDEASYLRERCRTGNLTLDAIQIASYAGYPAAYLVDHRIYPDATAPSQEIPHWILGLQRWGKEVLVEAARSAAITTLRAAKTIEGLEEQLTADQLRLLSYMIEATKNWENHATAISHLAAQIYAEIYETEHAEHKELLLVGSAFTWLGYTASWKFSTMDVLPKMGVQNAVYAAVQTGMAALGIAPKMALRYLKRDLVAWALRDSDE